jgi:hypothetical protein
MVLRNEWVAGDTVANPSHLARSSDPRLHGRGRATAIEELK